MIPLPLLDGGTSGAVSVLYRYMSFYIDENKIALRCLEFRVLKETPKGYWVHDDWHSRKRFVLKNSHKRFACVTKEQAMTSFKKRKERQIRILRGQLNTAKLTLEMVNANKVEIFDDSFTLT